MFTSESLHSEFKHDDVEVEMVVVVAVVAVVVECCCFLVNIIVVPSEPRLPLFLCNCRHF